ncbi:hypothetical protein DL771_007292 [Monosporascus sp. 5C6A]|nr:hypothetical protein DL771_007292 [Monosporascus sp. 5C6A]
MKRLDPQAHSLYLALTRLLDLKQKHSMGYVSKYVFGIGLGNPIPLIAMAFTLSEISNAASDALSAAKRQLCGLRRRPEADGDSSDIPGSEEEL